MAKSLKIIPSGTKLLDKKGKTRKLVIFSYEEYHHSYCVVTYKLNTIKTRIWTRQ